MHVLGFEVQCSFWGGRSLGSSPITSAFFLAAGALALNIDVVLRKYVQWMYGMYGMNENASIHLAAHLPSYLSVQIEIQLSKYHSKYVDSAEC